MWVFLRGLLGDEVIEWLWKDVKEWCECSAEGYSYLTHHPTYFTLINYAAAIYEFPLTAPALMHLHLCVCVFVHVCWALGQICIGEGETKCIPFTYSFIRLFLPRFLIFFFFLIKLLNYPQWTSLSCTDKLPPKTMLPQQLNTKKGLDVFTIILWVLELITLLTVTLSCHSLLPNGHLCGTANVWKGISSIDMCCALNVVVIDYQ